MTTDEITADNLNLRLQERLSPTQLAVVDESGLHNGHAGANGTGFGTHFRVRIASPFFTNKSLGACHRLVYDAVQDFIDAGLHALAIEVIPNSEQ